VAFEDQTAQQPTQIATPRATTAPDNVLAAPDDLVGRVALLEEQWTHTAQARRAVAGLLAFAEGDQIASTPGMPDETSRHQSKKARFAPNFLGLAVDLLSYLYAEDPIRTSDADDRWDDILWSYRYGLSALLEDADPAIRLGGTSLAFAHPASSGEPQTVAERIAAGGADGVDVFIVPADRFVASTYAADPRAIATCAILQRTETIVQEVSINGVRHPMENTSEVEVHEYWDAEWYAILNDWKIVEAHKHGLGGIPCRTLKNTLSPLSIYGRPLGGVDTRTNFETINALFEEVLHVGRLQRGQPVAKGDYRGKLGPDAVIEVDIDGDFFFLSNAGDVPHMVDALVLGLTSLARTLHLPIRTFKVKDTTAISAISIVTDRIELKEDRRKRSRLAAKQWEPAIHEIAALVARRFDLGDLDPSAVTVRHPQGSPPLTHAEMLAQSEYELANGLASKAETKQALHPYLTPTEIEALLAAAEADAMEDARKKALVAGHADDVEPTTPDPAAPEEIEGDDDAE